MQNQSDLEKQIAIEAAEVAAAPRVESSGNVGRCHFCGAITRNLQFVERVDNIDRYRGEECCGH